MGYLGEKDQENWWPTAFFAPTSKLFLEPVMPRTARLAQYSGVCEAARRLHNDRVAIGQVYHLFRLPEEVEQDLHQTLLEGNDDWFEVLTGREKAIAALERLASGSHEVQEGPQSLGQYGQLYRPAGAKTLAYHYADAFRRGIQSYPYFTR